MTLTENQKKQSDEFKDLCYSKTREQLFAYYVSWHPNLYAGVNLDKSTIDYINNYFYEYKVDSVNFHRHYLNALRHATPIYNNLKAIEFNKKVFDIITNKTVRKLAKTAIDNIQENGTINKNRHDSGTITDSGSVKQNTSENQTNNKTINESNDSRNATKQLPMKADGNFDDLFNWAGASNVNEIIDENENTENATMSNTANAMTYTGNTRTLATQITNEDTNALTKIQNAVGNDKETLETIGDQGVELIEKIWNYLIEPKSIDYLIGELEEAFITVY